MSWDIFVFDMLRGAKAVEDIPADFKQAPISRRSDVIAGIRQVVPEADFSRPSWGSIEGDGWSIELNMGDEEECDGFAFHVRGGDAAVGVVAAILSHLDLRAVDSCTGDFFAAGPESLESFRKWRAYRDRVVGSHD